MPKDDSSQQLQDLFDASQEVAREAVASALRIAKERGLDPTRLLRVSFQSLQGLTFGTMGVGPAGPKASTGKGSSGRATKRS